MKILSIETASKICAVALLENDKLIKEKLLEDENTHSVKLMPLVDELLKHENVTIHDIDLFACDKGPGSFTGVRIGVSTVKAFLDVTNKKAVGITSLEALAYNSEKDGIICTMLDAKNGNIYYGFFEKVENNIKQLEELNFDNISNVLEKIYKEDKQIIFIGDASQNYEELIKSKLAKKAIFLEDKRRNKLNARNIGLAAYYKKEEAIDSNELIPTYLRKSNAER